MDEFYLTYSDEKLIGGFFLDSYNISENATLKVNTYETIDVKNISI